MMNTMIFLCFSSKDRYTIVESILYHLKNYGLKVWYDYHTLILGDNKIKENIVNGVQKSNYVILIISPNFYDCECGNMELNEIKKLYELNKIHIFPILYNVKAKELPAEYLWITNLIYNELSYDTMSLPTCNQIICQVLKDEIKQKKYLPIESIKSSNEYINKLIKAYNFLDNENINSKLTLLYCAYKYLEIFKNQGKPHPCGKIFEQLFKSTALNISIAFKELIIAEYSIIIMLYEKEVISDEVHNS